FLQGVLRLRQRLFGRRQYGGWREPKRRSRAADVDRSAACPAASAGARCRVGQIGHPDNELALYVTALIAGGLPIADKLRFVERQQLFAAAVERKAHVILLFEGPGLTADRNGH